MRQAGVRDLPSFGIADASSVDDLVALAKRLNATVLAYWVGASSTAIWTLSPEGRVHAARTENGENTLNAWINEALRPPQQTSTHNSKTVQLVSRSGDVFLTGGTNHAAWRRLYNALIQPVRSNLPVKGTRRLVIIPNGPLFRLSFAALMDEKGRYLIEDYSLQYTPNAAVMNHTLEIKQENQKRVGQYLFVSNPSDMPPLDSGKTLPQLPGSDEEVKKVTTLFSTDSVASFRGRAANEVSVRRAMESAKVIHLATHGIVSNEDPFASYVALARGSDASADGRLSAQEIYGLNLHADLVVLSACRTGLGRISGDGVAGLARAFLYAGAASVVATLWDVPDGPASQLVAEFYQSMGPILKNDKSEALRNAQLRLLRALRRGEVHVDTPFGRLPLPEDPSVWAGFVLVGEP
jgi:CHAT domain-containing protein